MNDTMKIIGLEMLKKVINQVVPIEEAAWEALSSLFTYKKMRKGTFFVREGIYDNSVCFIIKGAMRAFYVSENGSEYNKTFFIENSFAVSLASALTAKPGYLNFQLLEDCLLLVTKYSHIVALYEKFHSIETLVRKVIEYEWVVKKEQREISLATSDACERYHQFQKDYPGLDQRIPQYHIASNLGITPIQLSRIRRMLSKNPV